MIICWCKLNMTVVFPITLNTTANFRMFEMLLFVSLVMSILNCLCVSALLSAVLSAEFREGIAPWIAYNYFCSMYMYFQDILSHNAILSKYIQKNEWNINKKLTATFCSDCQMKIFCQNTGLKITDLWDNWTALTELNMKQLDHVTVKHTRVWNV